MKQLRLNSNTWDEITPESRDYIGDMFYKQAHEHIQNAVHELTDLEHMTTNGSFGPMSNGQIEGIKLELDELYKVYEQLIDFLY